MKEKSSKGKVYDQSLQQNRPRLQSKALLQLSKENHIKFFLTFLYLMFPM